MTRNLFDDFGKLEPIKKEEKVLLNCYIPEDLRSRLKLKSVKEKTPMKDLVVKALRGYYSDLK